MDFKNGLLHVNKTIQRIYIKEKNKCVSKIIITSPKTTCSKRIVPINNDFLIQLKKVKKKNENYIITGNNKLIEPRVYRNYFNNVLKN